MPPLTQPSLNLVNRKLDLKKDKNNLGSYMSQHIIDNDIELIACKGENIYSDKYYTKSLKNQLTGNVASIINILLNSNCVPNQYNKAKLLIDQDDSCELT